MFGSKKEKENKTDKMSYLTWIPLTTIHQLEEIKQQSNTKTVLIFKHSTRCGISSMVIKRFEAMFKEEHQSFSVYYLDLLNYRNISDEIGFTFQVMHQSPQLLIIKNGVSVFHASHYDILETNLTRFL